jgi:hypothetical protein
MALTAPATGRCAELIDPALIWHQGRNSNPRDRYAGCGFLGFGGPKIDRPKLSHASAELLDTTPFLPSASASRTSNWKWQVLARIVRPRPPMPGSESLLKARYVDGLRLGRSRNRRIENAEIGSSVLP